MHSVAKLLKCRATNFSAKRGDAKHRTRNLEIPRCAIAHLRSGANAPSWNDGGRLLRRFAPRNDEEKVSVARMSEAKSGSGCRDYARDLGKQRDHNNFLPDGQITSCFPKWPVQPLLQKYFCFGPRQISSLIRAVPPQQRGVRTSRTRGGMRWTRAVRLTKCAAADGEVVWF